MTSPARTLHACSMHTRLKTLVVTAVVLLAGVVCCTPSEAQYNGPPTNLDRSGNVIPTADQTSLYPNTPDTLLASGDLLTIRLFGDTDYNVNVRVGVDGTVLMPLIGIVNLQGLSITAAEELIAHKLETAGMYKNPQVLLQISEGPNAIITVAGEMHAVVPVIGARSLYAVLASGGGLPNSASRTVTILRPGKADPISVDIGNDPMHSAAGNLPIFPGDTVVVSRIGVVYILGEFRSPGVIPLTNYGPLTLTQVTALVGGPVFDAKYNELHIIRTVGDHRTVSTLNIKDVLYGRRPDPIIQPNDIIFLPPSTLKASVANGSLGSILGVISFAIAVITTIR